MDYTHGAPPYSLIKGLIGHHNYEPIYICQMGGGENPEPEQRLGTGQAQVVIK